MLRELCIKNFAIIDDLTINFNRGFNVLTGETGAGKSIIIDALGILIGERSNSSLVRKGAQKAYIEGVFNLDEHLRTILREINEDFSEPELFLSRDIYSDGHCVSKINGRNVPVNVVKQIAQYLIDIHSQHDNQYLMKPDAYLNLLDYYGSKNIIEHKRVYQNKYTEYIKTKKKLEELENTQFSQEDIDYLNFQIKEIEELNLKKNEIEELEEEEKRFSKHEFIGEQMNIVLGSFGREDGILEQLYVANKALQKLYDDELFTTLCEQLETSYHQLTEIRESISQTFDSLDFDPNRLMYIKERLYAIGKVRRKHGSSYAEIVEKLETMKEKVMSFDDYEQQLIDCKLLLEKQFSDTKAVAQQLSSLRQKISLELNKNVIIELKDLYLDKASFEIAFSEVPLNESGIDKLDFTISMNPGQPLKSLAKVASGGEISRLMLGLKVIFNRLQGINVVVFDEIDTGVSGKVARAVGEKMNKLAENCQVLCITHLPQVASLGENHFHVDKIVVDDQTSTIVNLLDNNGRIEEIAKLISGEEVTVAALETAKELLKK